MVPGEGCIWTPGYWAYAGDDDGYYNRLAPPVSRAALGKRQRPKGGPPVSFHQ